MPHAVPSLNNELLSRVVFARMKVRDDADDENYVSGDIHEDDPLMGILTSDHGDHQLSTGGAW